jgi:hypothetical protein
MLPLRFRKKSVGGQKAQPTPIHHMTKTDHSIPPIKTKANKGRKPKNEKEKILIVDIFCPAIIDIILWAVKIDT